MAADELLSDLFLESVTHDELPQLPHSNEQRVENYQRQLLSPTSFADQELEATFGPDPTLLQFSQLEELIREDTPAYHDIPPAEEPQELPNAQPTDRDSPTDYLMEQFRQAVLNARPEEEDEGLSLDPLLEITAAYASTRADWMAYVFGNEPIGINHRRVEITDVVLTETVFPTFRQPLGWPAHAENDVVRQVDVQGADEEEGGNDKENDRLGPA